MRDILGVGTSSWEDSLRRRSGAGKRAGLVAVFYEISYAWQKSMIFNAYGVE
jgi:hypothetical protein